MSEGWGRGGAGIVGNFTVNWRKVTLYQLIRTIVQSCIGSYCCRKLCLCILTTFHMHLSVFYYIMLSDSCILRV